MCFLLKSISITSIFQDEPILISTNAARGVWRVLVVFVVYSTLIVFFSYNFIFHTFISNLIFSVLNVFYVLLYVMLYIVAV